MSEDQEAIDCIADAIGKCAEEMYVKYEDEHARTCFAELTALGYRRVGPGECVVRRELVDDAINAIDEGRGHLGDYLFEKYKHPEIIVELSLAAAPPSESGTK